MVGPLDGIKVLDLTQSFAGPFTSMLLADMGAEVIKVEIPGTGDLARRWAPLVKGESGYFLMLNRNKKSLTLNLKKEEGKEILFRLAEHADVFMESFRPGTVERLGIDYEAMKKINLRIIYCQISGFGQDGPYRDMVAMDPMMQGMAGLMSITGEPGGPPLRVGIAVVDTLTSLLAAYGVLAALVYRERTGKGQRIDASLFDSAVASLTLPAAIYFFTGKVAGPMGNKHPLIVPYQAFKTKDSYINVSAGSDRIWGRLCQALGLESLIDDPRFRRNFDRVKNRDELERILDEILLKKSTDEWLEIFRNTDIPSAPINRIDKVFSDPQVLHRRMVVEIEHPTCGKIKVLGIPLKLSEMRGEIKNAPPLLGQHSREILLDLGYNDEFINKLKKKGVI